MGAQDGQGGHAPHTARRQVTPQRGRARRLERWSRRRKLVGNGTSGPRGREGHKLRGSAVPSLGACRSLPWSLSFVPSSELVLPSFGACRSLVVPSPGACHSLRRSLSLTPSELVVRCSLGARPSFPPLEVVVHCLGACRSSLGACHCLNFLKHSLNFLKRSSNLFKFPHFLKHTLAGESRKDKAADPISLSHQIPSFCLNFSQVRPRAVSASPQVARSER